MTLVLKTFRAKNAHPLNVTFVLDDDVQGCENVQSIVDVALNILNSILSCVACKFLEYVTLFLHRSSTIALPNFFHYFLGEEHEIFV